MKAKIIGVAALLAAALAACGGKASFDVSGTIAGLTNSGLVLASGSDTVSVPAGATSYTFPKRIDYGTEYHITVKTQPEHMTCTPVLPDGAAGRSVSISVHVNCVQNSYTVGGAINGFTGDQIVLANGSTNGTYTILKGQTSFTFLPKIPVGQAYGLTIQTQPKEPAQVCTIENGTGIMGDYDRANVVITCQ